VHVIYPSWSAGPSSSAQFLFFYLILHFLPRSPPYNNNNAQSSVCVLSMVCSWARTAGLGQLQNLPSSINPSIWLSVWTKVGQLLYLLSFRKQLRCTDEISSKKRKGLDPFLCLLFVAFNWTIVTQMALQVFLTRLNSSLPPFLNILAISRKQKSKIDAEAVPTCFCLLPMFISS
jgi:hypothetical protein